MSTELKNCSSAFSQWRLQESVDDGAQDCRASLDWADDGVRPYVGIAGGWQMNRGTN